MRRIVLGLLIVILILGGLALRPGGLSFTATPPGYDGLRDAARTPAEEGAVIFAFGDWGALSTDTLRTSAAPWKLVNAAMALDAAGGDPLEVAEIDIADLYSRFGFHSPLEISNWPTDLPPPTLNAPLGQSVGIASGTWPPVEVTISNIGCAACHSSVMYDATGAPDTTRVWLGGANGSINLEAWTQALYSALRDRTGDASVLMEAVTSIYPDTTRREQLTLRYAILPILRSEIAAREASTGRLLPFRASLAGATNGLDSLRNRLNLIPEDTLVEESIFNSVPDLGGRLWRTKLLNSGSYVIEGADPTATVEGGDITPAHREGLAGIIAYFTVPSMGVSAEVAEAHIPDATRVADWMMTYRPQPFPGEVDPDRAREGRAIYAEACAVCHGDYDNSLTEPRLIRFPNWEGDVGTDPERARLLTDDVAEAVNSGLFGRYIDARTVAGYTAPPLTGIWSSAPYLHNGSVPTLWHLMRPETRPARFDVGGHRLDLHRIGIDLDPPAGFLPWSIPAEVDTGAFGLSATGHEVGFEGLSDAEKDALLDYLKLL